VTSNSRARKNNDKILVLLLMSVGLLIFGGFKFVEACLSAHATITAEIVDKQIIQQYKSQYLICLAVEKKGLPFGSEPTKLFMDDGWFTHSRDMVRVGDQITAEYLQANGRILNLRVLSGENPGWSKEESSGLVGNGLMALLGASILLFLLKSGA
jgi:hypothetical protein